MPATNITHSLSTSQSESRAISGAKLPLRQAVFTFGHWPQTNDAFRVYMGQARHGVWRALGRVTDHNLPPNAEDNTWSCTSTHPIRLHRVYRGNFTIIVLQRSNQIRLLDVGGRGETSLRRVTPRPVCLDASWQHAFVVEHISYFLLIKSLFGPRNPNSIFRLIIVQHFKKSCTRVLHVKQLQKVKTKLTKTFQRTTTKIRIGEGDLTTV
jgi:hypothetical protein